MIKNNNYKLKMVYPGQVYKNKQNVGKLFKAVRELIFEGKIPVDGINISFYGTQKEIIEPLIDEYCLSMVVEVFDRVSKKEIFEIEKNADVLFCFDWEVSGVDPGCGTKLYEYLPLGVAILVIGDKDASEMRTLVETTHTGVYCKNIDELKETIGFWWFEKYGYDYKMQGC